MSTRGERRSGAGPTGTHAPSDEPKDILREPGGYAPEAGAQYRLMQSMDLRYVATRMRDRGLLIIV
jgi:hypothetical protein